MSSSKSISALLPPPRHSQISSSNISISNEVQKLVDVTATSDDHSDEDQLSGNENKGVTFENFLPLRNHHPNLELPMPTDHEVRTSYERTKAVLDKVLSQKISPRGTSIPQGAKQKANVKTIEYQGHGGGKTKSIQIVDKQLDPLQPRTFKLKKMVAPPPDEPFAPVLHKTDDSSPQLSKETRDQWNIPSAISNWKNPNGYAISLDRRVASDGRYNKGLSGNQDISEKFASLSEALDVAEKKAREEVMLRADAKRMLAEQDAREKEEKLRLLALRAREERRRQVSRSADAESNEASLAKETAKREQRRQLEKDVRNSKLNTADRLRALAAKQNREISDKVILGAAKASDTSGIQYDSRLFSRAASENALGGENRVYDNPLFVQEGINTIYRPNVMHSASGNEMVDSTLQSLSGESSGKRSREGPVEFTGAEREQPSVERNDDGSAKKHRAT
ncbi:LADA_0F07646g1_1 [Lachancea dasiensis]|uniref:Pre-mRNA-processing protein 45 n=1 Tax=Lachancea dasiensis TaxID=1072105 RepID=A0A1G4JKH4_9SACH|nr:LADA_0F07646g1_1 [Lachancea dasiensis]